MGEREGLSLGVRRGVVVLASLAVLVLVACEPFPNPEPVDPNCSAQPTNGLETRASGVRNYLLLVPPGLPSTGVGVPLLLVLHGLYSNGAQIAAYTPWQTMAPTEKFIVAYPNSSGPSWNHSQGSADVTFLRGVIHEIESTYCTDKSRVYVTGHSEGAYMTQRMACDASDVVASVAEYAGGSPQLFFGNTPCTPTRGISVGLFHGTADRVVPPLLGSASRDEWVARMHCDPTRTHLDDSLGPYELNADCDGGTVVTWRAYTGQGHLWPSPGPLYNDIRDKMWAFLMAFPHPTR